MLLRGRTSVLLNESRSCLKQPSCCWASYDGPVPVSVVKWPRDEAHDDSPMRVLDGEEAERLRGEVMVRKWWGGRRVEGLVNKRGEGDFDV